jgi:hypothetical protein
MFRYINVSDLMKVHSTHRHAFPTVERSCKAFPTVERSCMPFAIGIAWLVLALTASTLSYRFTDE